MRLPILSGVAMAAFLAASFGFVSLIQAAPLAGAMAAAPAVQMTEGPTAVEAVPLKAHDKMTHHHHHHHHEHHHHHHHHDHTM